MRFRQCVRIYIRGLFTYKLPSASADAPGSCIYILYVSLSKNYLRTYFCVVAVPSAAVTSTSTVPAATPLRLSVLRRVF